MDEEKVEEIYSSNLSGYRGKIMKDRKLIPDLWGYEYDFLPIKGNKTVDILISPKNGEKFI